MLNDLISLQSEKEVLAFVAYLNKRNKRHDTKNVELYKSYLKGEEQTVKDKIGSNAFRALKKRLTDQLIEFSSGRLMENELTLENKIVKLIVLAQKLLSSSKIKAGYTLLLKSEKLAIELEYYSFLNEIYHSMIEYSHLIEVDQDVLFEKLKRNNLNFFAEERLGIFYASMQKQFISESFKNRPPTFHEAYNKHIKAFEIAPELMLSYKSLNKLCELANLYGSQAKRYHELDLFFEPEIEKLKGTHRDSDKGLFYHIELLYGMANIYFRKKESRKSIFYLDQMRIQMKREAEGSDSAWEARYINLRALNLNFVNQYKEALHLLNIALKDNTVKDRDAALLQLSLAMMHFQQGNLQEVKNIIIAFKRPDSWYLKQMGSEWLFNLRAMEVLLHFDLGNDQLAESRIQSFKRKYGLHFKSEIKNPIWPFLKLIDYIMFNPEQVNKVEFKEKVKQEIPWQGMNEDVFNICFYAWLKSKMNRTPLYETTLAIYQNQD